MVKVKICGIKRLEDIGYLNVLLPDYAGFVFANSKRQVMLDQAKELKGNLNRTIKTVGVFQNQEAERVIYIAEHLKLDIIQLHGNEDVEYINKLQGFTVWKAVGADDVHFYDKLKGVNHSTVDALLIDSSYQGGTGKCFELKKIKDTQMNKKLVLAGGLSADNVSDAIKLLKPYGVDVSSGVEENGVKSFEKMKNFIEKARVTI